jgi:hypothetical protein
MNTYNHTTASITREARKVVAVIVLFLLTTPLFAQQATVLPGNGNYSQTSSPQGGLRYQRAFYLITPKEVKANGLANGNTINSIGFTLGAPQSDTTKGAFKVYLQNTTDTVSRVDTSWTNVTVTGTSYTIPKGLFPGSYEWQVRSICGANSNSPYSISANFTNDNLNACGLPTNLATSGITTTTATFKWESPSSTVTKYYIQYKSADTTGWTKDSSNTTFFNVTGLLPNKTYQWGVKTGCASSNSDYVSTSFNTNSTVSCTAPGNLVVGNISDTSAQVSWSAASGATYYAVQYRRVGTPNWNGTVAFSNNYTIKSNVVPGTTYEWQVRTVCAAGTGAWISGANFTTTGTAVCYPPVNLSTNAITDSSAIFKWASVAGSTSYEIRYRLKETISWTNAISPAAPMTLVHDDSLIIPKTAGAYNVTFKNGSAFTYTGSGIYVAWEYSQSAASLSTNNTTVSTTANTSIKGVNGVDSVKYLLSFIARSDTNTTGLQTRLVSTNVRPETRLGSSALQDSVAVLSVYALGNTAPAFTADSISALIQNYTNGSQDYPVTLTVRDVKTSSVRYTQTINITVPANSKQVVLFTGWSPTAVEKDSIIVSVPSQTNENVVNDNFGTYVQNVTNSIVSYNDGSNAVTQAGFGTSSGLLLVRYHVSSCGKINSVNVYLSSSASGHSVYAVALDASKNIIAQSSAFTPDSTQVNTYHTFYFANSPLLKGTDFYVGLAQQSGATSYLPLGVQWEGSDVRTNAYFRSSLDGTSLTDQPLPGRLMIGAELIPGTAPAITGNLVLCSPGSTTTLTAGSIATRFADSVISASSQGSAGAYSAGKALGTPDVYPDYGLNGNAWASSSPDGGREYLVLHFPNAAPVNFIDIYETFNPGAIDTIFVKDPSAGYVNVYTSTATAAAKTARKNRITFPLTAFNVSEVRIAINSNAVSGFNSIDAVGIGQLTTPATFSNYTWTGGDVTQTKTVSGAGDYTLTVTDANGCHLSDRVTVVAPVHVVPTITAIKPATFCTGDSTILKSNQTSGNTWSTGATTDSIIVKTGGSYTVSYNDGTGCGSTTSATTAVTVNSLPTVSIAPHTVSICPNGSASLDAGSGYANYVWSTGAVTQSITATTVGSYNVKVTDANGCKASDTVAVTAATALTPTITGNTPFCPGSGATLDAGAGYSSYVWSTGATTRTINVTTQGNFSVTVTNSTGCSGSASVTTTLLPKPLPGITGNLTFCPGTTTTLDAGAGYSSYSWSTGATSQTIIVSTAGNYSVTVTNSDGCSGSANVTTSLFNAPKPTISGNTGFCPGGSTTLTGNSGFNSYLWSTNETTPSINVGTANTYTLTVTDANNCTASTSVPVIQNTPPSPVISGTLSFCGGNSTTLDAGAGYSAYSWSTGATTEAIIVTTVGTFTATVTDSKGCQGSASATTTMQSSLPATPGPISGNAFGVCNSTQTYTISPVPNAQRYVWTVPNGATIVSGQGTTSLSVSFIAGFNSGDLVVAAANTCGQSASSTPRTLTVNGTAQTPGAITGATTAVCGPTTKTYSIAAVSSATSYTWTVPTGASITSGQGSTSITVSFASGYVAGNICVKSNSACGSSGTSCITVAGIPPTPGPISGIVSVCSKQKNVTYSVTPVAGATSYTWTVPSLATINSGQGTNSIVVTYGTKVGNITVKATGTCGTSGTQSLTVNQNCTGAITAAASMSTSPEVSPTTQIIAYPNPSNGIVTLKMPNEPQSQQYEVRVFDAHGKNVFVRMMRSDGNIIVLDLKQLAKGLYIINVSGGQENEVVKVVLQ